MSTDPPAPNGTIMVMGCEGQPSAAAAHDATTLSIAASEYE
jgi:hypothetical protein